MAEFQELNQQVKDIWHTNADFWNERMGEGNDFHKELIEPSQLRLLDLKQGERVLDVACGNGQFARKMAGLGARVVAIDIAEGMIENARARTTENADNITYGVMDATDAAELSSLGERRFDAAVCTMAIMDMASVGPLVSALGRLLKAGGRFVFSVQHPCFNSPDMKMVGEVEDRDGEVVTEYSVKVAKYGKSYTRQRVGHDWPAGGATLLSPRHQHAVQCLFRRGGSCWTASKNPVLSSRAWAARLSRGPTSLTFHPCSSRVCASQERYNDGGAVQLVGRGLIAVP